MKRPRAEKPPRLVWLEEQARRGGELEPTAPEGEEDTHTHTHTPGTRTHQAHAHTHTPGTRTHTCTLTRLVQNSEFN